MVDESLYFVEPGALAQRLEVLSTSYRHLNHYSTLYHGVKERFAKEKKLPPRLVTQVAEKAVDAERSLRTLLYSGMGSMNELMDSGMMEKTIESAIEQLGSIDIEGEMESSLDSIRKLLGQRYPNVELGFFDEMIRLYREYSVDVRVQGDNLLLRAKDANGKKYAFCVEKHQRSGQLGRVSARELFVPQGITGASLAPPLFQEGKVAPVLDVYGGAVTALRAGKAAFYRHTRQVNETGLSRFSAQDPITAVVLVLVGLIAAVVIAMAVIGLGCEFEWWSDPEEVCTTGLIILLVILAALIVITIAVATAGGVGTTTLEGALGPVVVSIPL